MVDKVENLFQESRNNQRESQILTKTEILILFLILYLILSRGDFNTHISMT